MARLTRNQKIAVWAIIIPVVLAIIGGAFRHFNPRKESVSVSQEITASNTPYVLVGGDLRGDFSIEQKINNGFDELLLKYGDSQRKLGSTEREVEQLKGEITEVESELQVTKKKAEYLEGKIRDSKKSYILS